MQGAGLREIYTIGHSNRSVEEFLRLLLKYGIECVADVRRFPSSRHPHFTQDRLKEILEKYGIAYVWFESLGGYRRRILDSSPNTAIQSEGFRNYADYMLTDSFTRAIEQLEALALEKRTAIMCAERFFWRCHRKFISDFLVIRGWRVIHILDNRTIEHRLSQIARVAGGKIIYDKAMHDKK